MNDILGPPNEGAKDVPVFRSRYAICDDCECVTIIERNDSRGVPDEEQWEEFGRCMVCGESVHHWDANERTVDDTYWALGKAAARRPVSDLLDEYESASNPAPYTSERALYERLCFAVHREPLNRPALHGPLRTSPASPTSERPERPGGED